MQLPIKNVAVAFAILGRAAADNLASPTGGFLKYCENIVFYFEDDGSLAFQADCTGTGPMGPPSICSSLTMNQCFGVNSGGAVFGQEKYGCSLLCRASPLAA